jgi:hypothetical protein
LGYSSEGWTAEKAALELAKLKNASKVGEGHSRLGENRKAVKKKIKRQKRDALLFGAIFNDKYFPETKAVEHAIQLSEEKYCSAIASLNATVSNTYRIFERDE